MSKTSFFIRPLTEQLLIGSAPRSLEDIAKLKEAGVTKLLSLQTDSDLEDMGIQWSFLWGCLLEASIEVNRQPIEDHNQQDLRRKLPKAMETLQELMESDAEEAPKVFVHCSLGLNRSATLCLLWLARDLGFEKAKTLLYERHPRALPDEKPVEKWLKKRAGSLKKRRLFNWCAK